MISITCSFSQFHLDDSIQKPKARLRHYAREITSALRDTMAKIKDRCPIEIIESAAFVVLVQNMSEFVHNTIDACLLHQLPLENQMIKISIPEKIHQHIKISYQDTAGGFSESFMEDKKSLDYFKDKLLGKKIYVSSHKTQSKNDTFIGGNGLALSQTCRFLKLHNGQLIVKNKDEGAEIIFISPPRPENKKPSFNNFKGLDFQNVFAYDEFSSLKKSPSRADLTLLNIPERNVTLQKLDSPQFNLSSNDSDMRFPPFNSP